MSEDNSERGAGGELHYREAVGMGETVGEARWVALRKLERQVPNLDKDSVEYVVVREGQRGLLGVGFEESEVIARAAVSGPTTPPSPPLVRAEESGEAPPPAASDEPEARFVVDLLQRISAALQVDARVEVAGRGEDTITASFEGSDLGVLIGRRGQTIDAIEHIVSAATSRRAGRRIELTVDAARYRVRRERMLATIAENAARGARRTGEPVTLEPMSAPERKIIHLHLRDTEGIETQSEGIEPHRCVVVRPAALDIRHVSSAVCGARGARLANARRPSRGPGDRGAVVEQGRQLRGQTGARVRLAAWPGASTRSRIRRAAWARRQPP